ncbi:Acyl-coenzyme A dehydrogenase FadE [hydrothermal vent metagenome]|uniref:Acyl-coenzyme A dehydrogenase n=1 Tax=hydrothermal vent metagenome TaxID=652676 RepID=A0A3B1AYU2_9ZZZZ
MEVLVTLIIIGAFWTLAYQQVSGKVWLASIGLLLVFVTASGAFNGSVVLLLWAAAILIGGLLWHPELRQRYISTHLLKKFRDVLPPMSDTEREALEAGTVWWDGELFSGRPDWNKLLEAPAPKLSQEEQDFLDGPVEELCLMLDDWNITQEELGLPPAVWEFIGKHRFFGMIIPKAYGGLEFSALAHSTIVMKISSRSVTAAVTIMVPNSLGPAKLLLHDGTEAQKDYYLPRLAKAQEIPCFALTGPDAGSDAGAMPDRGVVCRGQFEGKEVLGICVNWDKRYITLGPVATVIGLAFKLFDPDHLLGDEEELGITVALIPTDTPGITIGARHIPLNIPFQNGPNYGHDVFVPMEWIIGGQTGIGQGWRMLMDCLAEGRSISLPALATGAGKAASRYTGAYARIRRQFNMPIGYFEGVEEALARIAALTYQMDAARSITLGALDSGEMPSVVSAIIKYHLTERYRKVTNDAMDIQGGSGICLGPNNLLGRVYQAIPISITVEGANILTRSMIIFGQGAIRCHPYVLKEFTAAQTSDNGEALKQFDDAIFGHISFLLSNLARSFFLGLSRGKCSTCPPKGPNKRYFQYLNWMSASFALCADVAMMTLGGELKRKERLSARLGDVLSELYLASAVLKHFENQGSHASDLPLLRWALDDGLYRMQESLRSLLRNLPNRPLAFILRYLIFPTGMPFVEPDDRRGHEAARLLLSQSEARDRLTAGIFITNDPETAVGRLELALALAGQVAPIEKALSKARRKGTISGKTMLELAAEGQKAGVITEEEASLLGDMETLRSQVIQVDSFDNYGKPKEKKTVAKKKAVKKKVQKKKVVKKQVKNS